MIFQYMQEVSNSFYNFAWQYSASVQNNANTMAVEDIITKYKNLPAVMQLPPLQNRDSIAIRNLSFTYKDAHKRSHTLRDVNMNIRK